MKRLFFVLLISTYGYATTVLANCPTPHTIVYKCIELNGKKICTWNPESGWYQGSADYSPSLQDGDRLSADSFFKAIWFPYRDETHGATTCYYIGPEAERITLFQQTGYGTVPPPTGHLWKATIEPDFPGGLECTFSTTACQFDFGQKR